MRKNPLLMINYRNARRLVVAISGGTVLLVGLAMVVLPGPAMVVIPAGLAILAVEFAWARRWLRKVKKGILGNFSPEKKPGGEG
jgi:tellurite resistance protein TerC